MKEDVYRWICEGLFAIMGILAVLACIGLNSSILTYIFIPILFAFGVFFKLLNNEICKRVSKDD